MLTSCPSVLLFLSEELQRENDRQFIQCFESLRLSDQPILLPGAASKRGSVQWQIVSTGECFVSANFSLAHIAACFGRLNSLECFLGSETGLVFYRNKNERTPLHLAGMNGHVEAVVMLIDAGADVMARDNGDNTPLHWAARFGHAECCVALVERGADLGAVDRLGQTPLHQAAAEGQTECARVLVSLGADINRRSSSVRTPLHLAAFSGHAGTVEELLVCGADGQARDRVGRTAKMCARGRFAYDEVERKAAERIAREGLLGNSGITSNNVGAATAAPVSRFAAQGLFQVGGGGGSGSIWSGGGGGVGGGGDVVEHGDSSSARSAATNPSSSLYSGRSVEHSPASASATYDISTLTMIGPGAPTAASLTRSNSSGNLSSTGSLSLSTPYLPRANPGGAQHQQQQQQLQQLQQQLQQQQQQQQAGFGGVIAVQTNLFGGEVPGKYFEPLTSAPAAVRRGATSGDRGSGYWPDGPSSPPLQLVNKSHSSSQASITSSRGSSASLLASNLPSLGSGSSLLGAAGTLASFVMVAPADLRHTACPVSVYMDPRSRFPVAITLSNRVFTVRICSFNFQVSHVYIDGPSLIVEMTVDPSVEAASVHFEGPLLTQPDSKSLRLAIVAKDPYSVAQGSRAVQSNEGVLNIVFFPTTG